MRSKIVAVGLALALAASASWAYTVYLKDGSKLVAKDKYQVQGDMAFIVLQNGTRTSIKLSEIDEERSRLANQSNYGTAVVLDEKGQETLPQNVPPPPPRPELKDLIASRPAAPAPGAPASPSASTTRREAAPAAPTTGGNAAGFSSLPRTPLPRLEVAAEIKQQLRAKGIEDVLIYRGSRGDRALLEITTNSEAAIFRSLEAAAAVLLQMKSRGVNAFEVSMTSSARERAGEFTLTPELATQLAQKQMETSAFYVQHVVF